MPFLAICLLFLARRYLRKNKYKTEFKEPTDTSSKKQQEHKGIPLIFLTILLCYLLQYKLFVKN